MGFENTLGCRQRGAGAFRHPDPIDPKTEKPGTAIEVPDACNLYRDLKFPDGVYEHIEQYREAKARAEA